MPLVAETKRSLMRSVVLFHYRIDATSDGTQCVEATFNIMLRYIDKNGKPALATYPGSIRFWGAQGSEFGELPGRKLDSQVRASIEDISCKRC